MMWRRYQLVYTDAAIQMALIGPMAVTGFPVEKAGSTGRLP